MFNRLKKAMQDRIERDGKYSVINGREVILKQSKLPLVGGDWSEIHPPVNEDGTWNIPNAIFGGKRNLIILLIMLAIAAMVLLQFYEFTSYINQLHENVCVQTCIDNPNIW